MVLFGEGDLIEIGSLGAYGTAMIGYYWGVPLALAMMMAAVLAVVVSVIIGRACLRLRGAYVALL
ncbi:MAG: branched-chain amino acid ABC transporter permease, partial [Fimbriimonadaceae bacterium]